MKRRFTSLFIAVFVMLLTGFFGTGVSAGSTYDIQVHNKTQDSFILTWEPQKGATAYKVMMYDKSSDEWTRYKTVISEKCVFAGLKASTSYKIKIRAVKKDGNTYERVNESGAVTVKTSGKKTSSRYPALPDPDKYGFTVIEAEYVSDDELREYIEDSVYVATISKYSITTLSSYFDDYKAAIKKKGYTVSDYVKLGSDDDSASYAYIIYYKGKEYGAVMEYYYYGDPNRGVLIVR